MSTRIPYEDAAELALLGGRDPQCGFVLADEAAQLGDLGCAGGCGGCVGGRVAGAKRGGGCGGGCGGQLGDLGAVETFNAQAVWADVQAGGAPYTPGTPESICTLPKEKQTQYQQSTCPGIIANANFRGGRATQAIREGLVELGYGQGISYGVGWSEENPGKQWKAFLADHGMSPGPGVGVTLLGLQQMQAELTGEDDVVPIPPDYDDQNDLPVPEKSLLPWVIGGLAVAGVATATWFVMR